MTAPTLHAVTTDSSRGSSWRGRCGAAGAGVTDSGRSGRSVQIRWQHVPRHALRGGPHHVYGLRAQTPHGELSTKAFLPLDALPLRCEAGNPAPPGHACCCVQGVGEAERLCTSHAVPALWVPACPFEPAGALVSYCEHSGAVSSAAWKSGRELGRRKIWPCLRTASNR